MKDSMGARLKQLREAKKMTRLDLSLELNMGQSTIWGYEEDTAIPRVDVLVKLSAALKCSDMNYIILGKRDAVCLACGDEKVEL